MKNEQYIYRILMIEDDPELLCVTAESVRDEGYHVDEARDGLEGLHCLLNGFYDLVILDRMLPYMDGTEVLRKARAQGNSTPILFLTAKDQIGDRVAGLDAGADDYLTKPFDMRELLARIRALVRRPAGIELKRALRYGDLRYEPTTLVLKGELGEVTLSRKEGRLIEPLLRLCGETASRAVLFGSAWETEEDIDEANLDTYAHFLRRRLSHVTSQVKRVTVGGIGYRLAVDTHD